LGDSNVFYFGGMNGFDRIVATSFAPSVHRPSEYVKGIQVNNEKLNIRGNVNSINLSHDRNHISFSIGLIDFINTSNATIQYRLEGADDKWKVTQPGELIINFASLSPGEYVLKLQPTNRNLDTQVQTADFAFAISPPFWQTWWFISLVVIVLSSLLYAFFVYRLNQKLEILRIRDNISRDLHDDIGGTLSSIRIYTEMLRNRPEEKSLLNLIQENVLLVLDKLDVITWASNPKNDFFQNLFKEMEQFVIPLFHSNQIAYTFRIENIPLANAVPGQFRQQLYLIFKEAVSNIIKHARCSKVDIAIQKKTSIFS
jgi:signal transduction histidine kinase